jgi:hypothetical protein
VTTELTLDAAVAEVERLRAEIASVDYVAEGWWHPNVRSGQVHDHTPRQSATMHRLCEQVYTRREARQWCEVCQDYGENHDWEQQP